MSAPIRGVAAGMVNPADASQGGLSSVAAVQGLCTPLKTGQMHAILKCLVKELLVNLWVVGRREQRVGCGTDMCGLLLVLKAAREVRLVSWLLSVITHKSSRRSASLPKTSTAAGAPTFTPPRKIRTSQRSMRPCRGCSHPQSTARSGCFSSMLQRLTRLGTINRLDGTIPGRGRRQRSHTSVVCREPSSSAHPSLHSAMSKGWPQPLGRWSP